jgi:hypothetical protein
VLSPTARFYELDRRCRIMQETTISISRKLVVFFIVYDTVAYRY